MSLKDGEQPSEALKKEMVLTVRKEIGAFASPDVIHWAPGASFKAFLLDTCLNHCRNLQCCTSLCNIGFTVESVPAGLPKTRSGKIMRRVLRKIATKEEDQLGDTSTLADPTVVESLLANRP